MTVSDNKLDVETDKLQIVPPSERLFNLDKKEFDAPEPDIEITYDGRIPSPFIQK